MAAGETGRWRIVHDAMREGASMDVAVFEALELDGFALLKIQDGDLVIANGDPDHYVTFDVDHWTVEHPLACRLSGEMHQCAHLGVVKAIADSIEEAGWGRWRLTIDSDGHPTLRRA